MYTIYDTTPPIIFGTTGPDDNITHPGTNFIARYWGLSGDDTFTGIGIYNASGDFRTETGFLFDGGKGVDRFVVPADIFSDQGYQNYHFEEVDPITFEGYTHRLVGLEYLDTNDTYQATAQALMREIEEFEGPDGEVGSTALGSLPWHAENAVQYLEDGPTFFGSPDRYPPGRDMVTLTDGTVVKLLKEDGGNERFFMMLDGDGNVIQEPVQFGPVDPDSEPGGRMLQQIAALDDGGFMVVWNEEGARRAGDNKLYAQAFDADGTARDVPVTLFDSAPDTMDSVIDYTITALDDGRAAVVANFNHSDYQRAFVVEANGSAATTVGTLGETDMNFSRIGTVGASDGFTMLTLNRDPASAGQVQFSYVATDFVENPDTGELEQQASRTLLTLPPSGRGEISEVSYARLGSDDLAALWVSNSSDRLELLTEIGGVVSSSSVTLPFDANGDAKVTNVSVNEASDGGAWVVIELAPDRSDPAAAGYAITACLAKLDAGGTLDTFVPVTDHAGGHASGRTPLVTETDDGVIVWWHHNDDGNAWVSLRDASGYNEVLGSSANEVLTGTAADDRIIGQEGDDTLVASEGLDRFIGGAGDDTLDLGGLGARYVTLQDAYLADAGNKGARAALISIENVTGGAGDDEIIGDDDLNDLRGGGGDDSLDGLASDDTMRGEAGNDDLRGGYGDDVLAGNADNDTIRGEEGNDRMFGGNDDDLMAGNEGNDLLSGGNGNDRLFGGVGNDTLIGGTGIDLLNGGPGADVFVWRDAGESPWDARDTIADFTPGEDLIDISAIHPSLAWTPGGFTGVAGQVWYSDATGTLWVDMNGSGGANFGIDLDGVTALDAGDLIL